MERAGSSKRAAGRCRGGQATRRPRRAALKDGARSIFGAAIASGIIAGTMGIEFCERPTQEHNFQLEVRKTGALIGHVRRGAEGFFQYYGGPLNVLMYEFEDDDLDRLKQRIASTEAPATLTY